MVRILMCPKCGSLMRVEKRGEKQYLKCPACGYETEMQSAEMKISTSTKQTKEIKVVESDEKILPSTKRVCPKCGNTDVYYELRQTRAADEPPTQFFQCKKCKHIWREY